MPRGGIASTCRQVVGDINTYFRVIRKDLFPGDKVPGGRKKQVVRNRWTGNKVQVNR